MATVAAGQLDVNILGDDARAFSFSIFPFILSLSKGRPVHGSTDSPRTDLADRMENEKALETTLRAFTACRYFD